MPKPKSAVAEGLTFLLNNPQTNPTTPGGKKVFDELLKHSGMGIQETLKYVGKKSKQPRVSDDQRSKERLEKLEQE
jgi:hypothetical protein